MADVYSKWVAITSGMMVLVKKMMLKAVGQLGSQQMLQSHIRTRKMKQQLLARCVIRERTTSVSPGLVTHGSTGYGKANGAHHGEGYHGHHGWGIPRGNSSYAPLQRGTPQRGVEAAQGLLMKGESRQGRPGSYKERGPRSKTRQRSKRRKRPLTGEIGDEPEAVKSG